MTVLTSKVLCFEKGLSFSKTRNKQNVITKYHNFLECSANIKTDTVVTKVVAILYCFKLRYQFIQCFLFSGLYLGRVYQTMPSSAYNRKASAPQTDSMDLMKINNVTSNVKPAEPSKTNKVTKVVTIVQYTANNQIKPSGRD